MALPRLPTNRKAVWTGTGTGDLVDLSAAAGFSWLGAAQNGLVFTSSSNTGKSTSTQVSQAVWATTRFSVNGMTTSDWVCTPDTRVLQPGSRSMI